MKTFLMVLVLGINLFVRISSFITLLVMLLKIWKYGSLINAHDEIEKVYDDIRLWSDVIACCIITVIAFSFLATIL